MKVVLDTNVPVSGLMFGGTPGRILTAWSDGQFSLVAVHAVVVNAPPLASRLCDDPDDDKFLAAALAGGATTVVSGDKHLPRVAGWQSIDVLKPRQFVDRWLAPD